MMTQKHLPLLWATTLLLFILSLFAKVAKPEWPMLFIGLASLFIITLILIIYVNRKNFKRENTIRGVSSITTVVLVLALLGLVNFIGFRYPKKLDFTKNKINTLSDQSRKAIQNTKEPLKLTLFSKPEQADDFRPLLDNIKTISNKTEVEFIDPLKESIRAQKAGLRSDTPTLVLSVGTRDQLIESPTEEKITNALIKLSKTNAIELCQIIDHGEKNFESNEVIGYSSAKLILEKQSTKIKTVNLITEGKIPADCSAIAVMGPNKAFFPQEMKIISDYLISGGKAFIALDLSLKGNTPETSPEFLQLLKTYSINVEQMLIIDPVSKAFQLDATLPIVATYSKEHPITRETTGNSLFPFSRPLTLLKGDPSVKLTSLAETTPNSWGESDIKGLLAGSAGFSKGDLKGPMTVAAAVEKGKTRIVVFSSSQVGSNQYSRFGNNLDLFSNSISWILEDESSISIRKNADVGGQIELSPRAAGIISLITIVIIPLLLIIAGVIIWMYRKKL